MRKKILFLVGIVCVVGLVVTLIRLLLGGTTKYGVLKVNSNQSASIFLDDKHIGKTPFDDKISAGEYTIKIVPETTVESLGVWQGKIIISPNLLTYVNRDLSNSELSSAGELLWLEKSTNVKSSDIAITTIPDGASVLVDDEAKGVAPMVVSDITPGDHTLSITSPGFLPRTMRIKTTGGYKLNASIQLALSPTGSQQIEEPQSASPSSELEPSPTANISETPKTTPTPTRKVSPTPTIKAQATPVSSESKKIQITDTPTGFLNVRDNPQGTVVAQVHPGDTFTISDEKNGWYEIEYETGKTGWISSQYTKPTE